MSRASSWSAALQSSAVLSPIVRPGKKALRGADPAKVTVSARCSLALDEDGPPSRKGEHRWDYLIVTEEGERAHAVEIHTATPGDVKEMIAKKEWATHLLAKECPGHTVAKWHWVARTRVDFPRHRIRERELLARANIEWPQSQVRL